MKITAMLAAAAFTLTASAAMAGQTEYGNGVYSPQKGVICDSMGKWCADGTGLSASWTEHYFGGAAGNALADATQDKFGFSNHVNCDINTKTCTGGEGKAAKKIAKQLFKN